MTKWLLLSISLSLLTVSGCKPSRKPTPVKPNPPTQSVADKVAELETSGKLPTLDRSNDIAGPDLDGNGIRDDVDAYINNLDLTEPQRKAVRQSARATQRAILVDTKDRWELRKVSNEISHSVNCLGDRIDDISKGLRLTTSIEAITANTKERAKRYNEYNAARSGSVSRLPNKDTCDE